jgi:hypothetical protein
VSREDAGLALNVARLLIVAAHDGCARGHSCHTLLQVATWLLALTTLVHRLLHVGPSAQLPD